MPQINDRIEDRAQDIHFTTSMVKIFAQGEVLYPFQADIL